MKPSCEALCITSLVRGALLSDEVRSPMLWIHRNLNLPRRERLRERDRNCEPEVPEFSLPKTALLIYTPKNQD